MFLALFIPQWRLDILASSSSYFSPYTFAYGVTISTGVGILVAAFVIFPLVERVTNAKQVRREFFNDALIH